MIIEQSYHGPFSSDRYWESRWRDEKATNDALVAAIKGLYDWYDSDGSVGAASEVFERHRDALRGAVGGSVKP